MHPAMYGERKFDMRVWAMITSIDPLRIDAPAAAD